jgi:hypothetical protein
VCGQQQVSFTAFVRESVSSHLLVKHLAISLSIRVQVLTDGRDTTSRTTPPALLRTLLRQNIVLDSIAVGSNAVSSTLTALSKATKGYAFAPISIQVSIFFFFSFVLVSGTAPS